MPLRCLTLSALLLLCVSLFACAGKESVQVSTQMIGPAPAVALAVDGPRLAVFGEYEGLSLTGSMDRTCMAGYGSMRLEAAKHTGVAFVCTADINSPPTQKGRVRGVLHCTDNRELLVSLRNIGPDQGVGVGRERPGGDLLILFYHVSPEEAERRFPAVKSDILAASLR